MASTRLRAHVKQGCKEMFVKKVHLSIPDSILTTLGPNATKKRSKESLFLLVYGGIFPPKYFLTYVFEKVFCKSFFKESSDFDGVIFQLVGLRRNPVGVT